jgi:hypothetical protein
MSTDPIDIRHLKEIDSASSDDTIPLYSITQGQNRKIKVSNFGGGGGGTSGFSGRSGYSGFSGASGFSGFSGVNGSIGTSGFSGFSGVNGSIGTSGFSGFSGLNGTSGFSGFSGLNGTSGFSGFSGVNGSIGISGFSGFSGAGISGFSGFSGAGLSGFSGFSGAAGTGVDTDWVYESLTFTSTGVSPTKGGGTVRDRIYWRRQGDSMQIRVDYRHTSAGGAGTGVYLIKIPNNQVADLNKVSATTGANAFTTGTGMAEWSDETTVSRCGAAVLYDSTHFKLADMIAGDWSASNVSFSSGILQVGTILTVPISGWSGSGGGNSGYSGFSGISGFSGYSGVSASSVILQTAETQDITTRSTSSTTYVNSGITAVLSSNLSNSSNKVRIRVSGFTSNSTTSTSQLTLFRDSSDITPVGRTAIMIFTLPFGGYLLPFAFEFIDTPGSTTPAVYKLYCKTQTGTLYIGADSTDTVKGQTTMVLEELAS